MSGGSYNYICHKMHDPTQLFHEIDTMKRMAEALATLGYDDIAHETREAVNDVRKLRRLCEAFSNNHRRLEKAWRAVEWKESFDITEESMHGILKEVEGEL